MESSTRLRVDKCSPQLLDAELNFYFSRSGDEKENKKNVANEGHEIRKERAENTLATTPECQPEELVHDEEVPLWLKKARSSFGQEMKTYSKNAIEDVCTIPMKEWEDGSLDLDELRSDIPDELSNVCDEPTFEDIEPEEQDYSIPEWARKEIINKDHHCGYCYQAFETAFIQRKHIVDEHPDFLKSICWCGKQFGNRHLLGGHLRRQHTPRLLCQYCGIGFDVTAKLDHHIQISHTNSEPLQCSLCPSKCKSVFSMKLHLRKIHPKTRFECEFCKKTFSVKGRLLGHMSLHTNSFRFKCTICPAKFTRNCNLQNHIKNNHNYVCAVCSANFLDHRSAKEHAFLIHTEEEVACSGAQFGVARITQFVCSICSRCLATKQALQVHEKTHKKSLDITDFLQLDIIYEKV